MKAIISLIVFVLLSVTVINAQIVLPPPNVFVVTDSSDAGTSTLRAGLQSGADTILINIKGTLVLNSSLNVGNDVVILGPSAKHFTIVTPPSVTDGIFSFNGKKLELSGVKITGQTGAATPIQIGTPTNTANTVKFTDCLFEAITVNGASAVLTYGINATNLVIFERCSFFDLSSDVAGGAVFVGSNTAINPGAVAFFMNCTFSACSTTFSGGNGGAIYVDGGSKADIRNCTFYNNSSQGSGSDLYVGGSGVANIRSNIFYNSDVNVTTVDAFASTAFMSYNNYATNVSAAFNGVIITSTGFQINLNSTPIEDGLGLKYFVFNDTSSVCIDTDTAAVAPVLYDQRRSWRKMQGKTVNGNNYIDAGAVEYTPFIVKNGNNSGAESFPAVANALTLTGLPGKKAIVFEVPVSNLPVTVNTGGIEIPIYDGSWPPSSIIVNGYSQSGSAVAGPGTDANSVTPAYIPIMFDKGGSVGTNLRMGQDSISVAGLAFVGAKSDQYTRGAGIVIDGQSVTVEGCHIGTDHNGSAVSTSNDNGIINGMGGNIFIGRNNFFYNFPMHISRNIISGNDSAQIRIEYSGAFIENNFIGLDGTGTNTISNSSSSGIVCYEGGESPIGITNNYIGGQDTSLLLQRGVGLVMENTIGFLYDGVTSASNKKGIILKDIFGLPTPSRPVVSKNRVGNITEENGITLERVFEAFVIGNQIGFAKDRTSANVAGVGIASYAARGYNNGSVERQGRIQKIKFNTVANCNKGLEFSLVDFINSGTGALVPSLSTTFYDSVAYNIIGIDTANVSNGFSNGTGIYIDSGVKALYIDSNLIALNSGKGVATANVYSTEYIYLSRNRIFLNGGNTGLGIDLDDNNARNITTANKPVSNDNVLPPELLGAVSCSGAVKVNMDLTIDNSLDIYKLELFSADSDYQEGFLFKKDTVFASGTLNQGTHNYTFSFPASIVVNDTIVATLTRLKQVSDTINWNPLNLDVGSTSEFSDTVIIRDANISVFPGLLPSACQEDTVTLNVTSVGVPNWYVNGALYSTGNPFGYRFDTVGTYTIAVAVDTLGCNDSVSYITTVNSIPTITMIHDTLICTGDTIDLAGVTSTTGGVWYDTIGNSPLTQLSVTPNSSDTLYYYYSVVSVDNGCINTDTLMVRLVSPTTVNAGQDSTICFGDSVNLGGLTGLSPLGGNWLDTLGVLLNAGHNYTVTPSSTDKFVYNYISGQGNTFCPNRDTVSIVVNPLPVVSVLDSAVCDGETIDLTGFNITPTTGGVWLNIDSISVTNNNAIVVTSDTSFFYSYTDQGTSCTNRDTATIMVKPLPAVSAGLDTNICAGASIDLASINGVYPTLGGVWNDGTNNLISTTVTPITATNYIYKVDSANGCSNQDTVHIGINLLPTVSVGSDIAICEGNSVDLDTINATPASGTWTTTDGVSLSNNNIVSLTVDSSFVYEYTDANGCSNTDILNVTLNDNPVLVATSITPDACSQGNGSVELFASQGQSPYQYSNDGNSYFSTTIFGNLLAGQVYTFYVMDNVGCSDTLILQSFPGGTGTVPMSPQYITPIIICEGNQVVITDTVSTNSNFTHNFVLYYDGELSTGTSNNNVFTISDTLQGLDSVSVTVDDNGCTSVSVINDINFVENNLVTATQDVCQGDNYTLTVWDGGDADTIVWLASTLQDTAYNTNEITINNISESNYVIEVIAEGCFFVSNINIIFSNNCDDDDVVTAFAPDGDVEQNAFFFIPELNNYLDQGITENTVSIYNRWGDLIRQYSAYNNDDNVWRGEGLNDVPLPEGTYYYIVELPTVENAPPIKGWVYLDR